MPPPPRERYHSSPRSAGYARQQRYSKKEDTRHTSKKTSRPATASSSAASRAAAPNAREVALREALAKALTNPNASAGATSSSALSEVDTYGNGSPTDRLQFGYSPAVAAEAAAFHSRFAAADWIAARKRNGHLVFAKKQKLSPLNCEPVTSILKLQRHWKKINAFQSDVHSGKSKLKAADLDQLLDMLASKQRIGEDE
ncbi:hypothetical protein ABB37_01496 [Leptomonas pyrrhocoris]|uniref:Uncharacterized protein n=1 Tax=Leptomonas pyrrhocoris TaxID=157538 RepID=A0A0M9G8P0_LEPPY|nr:hypothetical protein ABB37_01496 [Leptomonas pyrrhocoris]KPA85090.1 hypothetical protein ABB37_01496 [Leptomonas pyrrhocoris]|eukprot:XP_015663529.1 hypothetical protein ABB37_01496 [Leptomonas pyrrhocoris]